MCKLLIKQRKTTSKHYYAPGIDYHNMVGFGADGNRWRRLLTVQLHSLQLGLQYAVFAAKIATQLLAAHSNSMLASMSYPLESAPLPNQYEIPSLPS